MSSVIDAAGNLDPTGILSATTAAVRLVGAIAGVAPSIQKAANRRTSSGPGAAGGIPQVQQPVDPDSERQAYETVNFLLRILGTKICETGLVNLQALTKALTDALAHVEVRQFSAEANRLFASLAAGFNDPILVSSVFTAIYFIGAIINEFRASLPNYKPTYTPLGPKIVQQLFLASVGDDAWKDNLTAKLDAYAMLAKTAGLLMPTNIGYPIFPGFPALSPSRYSTKSMLEVQRHKSVFSNLVKHFQTYGFPQPKHHTKVSAINDWRFLSSNTNTRIYEVEKADKHIGEMAGRVIYWLFTSAKNLPYGTGVIVYFEQHIELVKWIGDKAGFKVLSAATDLEISGNHLLMKARDKSHFNTWLIICPNKEATSATAGLDHRQSSAQWAQMLAAQQTSQAIPAQSVNPAAVDGVPPSSTAASVIENPTPQQPVQTQPLQHRPSVQSHHSSTTGSAEYQPSIGSLSPQASHAATIAGNAVQATQQTLPTKIQTQQPQAQSVASLTTSPGTISSTSSPVTSPISNMSSSSHFPFPQSRPTIRRKAPPPPKKIYPARALYDFEAEEGNSEDLSFNEGDELEVVERSEVLDEDGWCRARLKGSKKIGLAPLEYLEISPTPITAPIRPSGGGPPKPIVAAPSPMAEEVAPPAFGLPVPPTSPPNQSATENASHTPQPFNPSIAPSHNSESHQQVNQSNVQADPNAGNVVPSKVDVQASPSEPQGTVPSTVQQTQAHSLPAAQLDQPTGPSTTLATPPIPSSTNSAFPLQVAGTGQGLATDYYSWHPADSAQSQGVSPVHVQQIHCAGGSPAGYPPYQVQPSTVPQQPMAPQQPIIIQAGGHADKLSTAVNLASLGAMAAPVVSNMMGGDDNTNNGNTNSNSNNQSENTSANDVGSSASTMEPYHAPVSTNYATDDSSNNISDPSTDNTSVPPVYNFAADPIATSTISPTDPGYINATAVTAVGDPNLGIAAAITSVAAVDPFYAQTNSDLVAAATATQAQSSLAPALGAAAPPSDPAATTIPPTDPSIISTPSTFVNPFAAPADPSAGTATTDALSGGAASPLSPLALSNSPVGMGTMDTFTEATGITETTNQDTGVSTVAISEQDTFVSADSYGDTSMAYASAEEDFSF